MDELEQWFKDNFPDEYYEQPTGEEPSDYDDDEPFPNDEVEGPDPMSELMEENARLKRELEEGRENGRKLMDAMHALTVELQHYQDATPLLYKLLTDLDLDVYSVGEYELLLSGDIATEHDEDLMLWTLRRIPPKA